MVKKILFLCGHNAGRSQMAQAFFNHLNKNKEFIGISAGTNIASKVNQECILAMKEIGIDLSDKKKYFPKKVNEDMLNNAHKIFTMGCDVTCTLPKGRKFDDDWNLDDPNGKSIEGIKLIRDSIKHKTIQLIKELEKEV